MTYYIFPVKAKRVFKDTSMPVKIVPYIAALFPLHIRMIM